MNDFSELARYYDRFVGADYDKITSFVDEAIKKNFPNASLVCDVGCGSGTVTLALLQRGYDMIGIDGSAEMLAEAMNKRVDISNGERALFLCQQLPEFELYGTVDAIVSTLDTINYITNEEDLDRLFYWFRNYLNPQGILIFDINSLYKYQNVLENHCDAYEDEDVFFVWRSQFDGVYCNHQLTYFLKNANKYERRDEEQLQRYYSEEEVRLLLKKYGFSILGVFDDYTVQKSSSKTQRLTFVVKKED